MNIGKLAGLTGVTPDTLRYYEREGLLDAPSRSAGGYRQYTEADAARVRFVRNAQALGFSLAQIRWIIPRLRDGLVDRAEIEQHLQAKIAEIDAHMRELKALKRELLATFGSLSCAPTNKLSLPAVTARPPAAPSGSHPMRQRRRA